MVRGQTLVPPFLPLQELMSRSMFSPFRKLRPSHSSVVQFHQLLQLPGATGYDGREISGSCDMLSLCP